MKKLTLVIIALAAVIALTGCGLSFDEPTEATPPVVNEQTPAPEPKFDDWLTITSTSDDELTQKVLKERFLAGIKDAAAGEVDEVKLADAIKWLQLDVPSTVVDKWTPFEEFILNDDTVLGVENVPEAQLNTDSGHIGLVEIRELTGSTTVVCWRAFVMSPEPEIGSWAVVYDDRDAEINAAARFNVLLYGLDRKLSNDEATQLALDIAKHHPDVLQGYHFAVTGEWLDVSVLVSNYDDYINRRPTTISPKGEACFASLKDELESASVTRRDLTPEEMANLFNSGSNGTSFNSSYGQGVGGDDVLAIVWELKSGRLVYALFRCGNPLIPAEQATSVPSGPTDDQPNPPDPTPTPENKVGWADPTYQSPGASQARGQNSSTGSGESEGDTPRTPLPAAHTHDFGPWVVETAPQPGIPGWEVRTCKKDGFTEGRAIAALPVVVTPPPPPPPPQQPGTGTDPDPGTIPSPQD